MWIRDELPKHEMGVRTVIYGYKTQLVDSKSFQRIPDLAQDLINRLQAYGWGFSWAKPITFLTHRLGGIILEEALVQCATAVSSGNRQQNLLNSVKGAIFFGTPTLGMEQEHFHTVVQRGPMEALVDDLAINSTYLRCLNERFFETPLLSSLKCFWAYELHESHTIQVCYPTYKSAIYSY